MQVSDFSACQFFELFDWTNTDNFFTIVRYPKRDGISPESVSWEAPIFSITEPVMELAVLNIFGNPHSFLIIFDQIFLKVGDSDEPSCDSFVDKRSITSPAIGIVMGACSFFHKSSAFFQILKNNIISIFDIHTFKGWNFFCESAVFVNWHWRIIRMDNLFLNAHLVIVLTKAWSTVDDTSTVWISNKISTLNSKTSIFLSIDEEIK